MADVPGYDRNALSECIARIIEPEAHTKFDESYANNPGVVTFDTLNSMPKIKASRDKAAAILALLSERERRTTTAHTRDAVETARAEERERAAQIAYMTCAQTRHVSLGDACAAAIRENRTMEDILADQAKRNVLRPGKTRLRPGIRQAGKDGGGQCQ